jgi:hypothetical protein
MNKFRKPNLFVVGMPKTGTTALYHYFRRHPDIYVPKNKEPNYFAQEVFNDGFKNKNLREYFSLTENGYHKYFLEAANQKYISDLTPSYIYSNQAAGRIYKYNPEAKIIAMFREPVSFLYSLHSEFVYSLMEEEKDFISALELESTRNKNKSHSHLYYSVWTNYKDHLDLYLRLFSSQQVKIFLYEKFKENNFKVLDEIASFLEIEPFEDVDQVRVNVYKKNRFTFIKNFVWSFPNLISYVKSHLPDRVFNFLTELYVYLTTKKSEKIKLDEGVVKDLKKRFLPNVVEFEKLLKENNLIERDFDLLKFWGYDKL